MDMTPFIDAGSTVVIAGLLWWTITKSVPQIVSEFRAEMQLVRDAHEKEIAELRAEHAEDRRLFREAIDRLAGTDR